MTFLAIRRPDKSVSQSTRAHPYLQHVPRTRPSGPVGASGRMALPIGIRGASTSGGWCGMGGRRTKKPGPPKRTPAEVSRRRDSFRAPGLLAPTRSAARFDVAPLHVP